MQSFQCIVHVDPNVEVISMGTVDQGHKFCVALTASNAPTEQPILAAQSNLLHQLLALVIVSNQFGIIKVSRLPTAIQIRNATGNPVAGRVNYG